MRFTASRQAWLVALVLALAYGALSWAVLSRGFPHEDAYILFKYARDVGRGAGIVFYPGGPRAEGATDFLWMLALAAGSAVHVDPALGAAVLDTAAFLICARLFAGALLPLDARTAPLVVATALLVLTPCAVAGYVGFGTTVFAVLALLLYRAYVRGEVSGIPAMGLVLGLLRPDGVVLAVAFALLALPLARERGQARRYLVACAACAAAGAAYFVWRWRYFGELLPLPLYVKSHHARVPSGVGDTADWALSTLLPLVGLVVAARLLLGRAPPGRRAWLGLAPFAAHVASFVLITTSQNVANRFQAPAALALLYLAMTLAADRARTNAPTAARTWGFVALSVVAFYPQAVIAADVLTGAFERQYLDVFAWWLARTGGPSLRIASTEAGRMLYWTDGPVLDLVGLSSPETARTPPGRALLSQFDPDVVMLHPGNALEENRAAAGRTGDVLRLDQPIATYVRPRLLRFLAPELASYDVLHRTNTEVAPVATLGWLATRGDAYELYAVRFRSRKARFHVVALRASLPEKDAILAELAAAHVPDPHASHLALTFAP
jgi:hypothetical protein